MDEYHKSVLLEEVIHFLQLRDGKWYLDATLGDGGYSTKILALGGNILGVDTDIEAIKRSSRRIEEMGISNSRYVLKEGNFQDLATLAAGMKFAGVIFDLGVSTLQLMTPERGFSFRLEGPLDMRMSKNLAVTAADLVNGLNKGELVQLFERFGEEPNAKRIAEAIIKARPIHKTQQLAELVKKVSLRQKKIHPATRVFQALRIAVNDELVVLKQGLEQALQILEPGGRVEVVSFHSLEDRIVKDTFSDWRKLGLGREITSKPVIPSEQEVMINPRARSSKLRVFEKAITAHEKITRRY